MLSFYPQDDMLEELRGRVLGLTLPGSMLFGLILILSGQAVSWPLAVSLWGFALIALTLLVWALLATARRLALAVLVLGYLGLALTAPRATIRASAVAG